MSDIMHPISIEALLNWILVSINKMAQFLAFVNFIMRILQKRFRYLEKKWKPLVVQQQVPIHN